jgi:hypothetical protein
MNCPWASLQSAFERRRVGYAVGHLTFQRTSRTRSYGPNPSGPSSSEYGLRRSHYVRRQQNVECECLR